MIKTAKQIQTDVFDMLRASTLADRLSGGVYREGYRPRDSRLEDAIVIFTAGLPTQIQTGIVTVNIYVPDIAPHQDGTMVEDGERTAEIEALAQEWAMSLNGQSCYQFSLQQTVYTMPEPELHQHFVVVKLQYRYFD